VHREREQQARPGDESAERADLGARAMSIYTYITEAIDAYLREVAANGEFPHVLNMLSAGPPTMEDNNFEQGLVWLMDGLVR
jgi:hypothetical protein